MKLLKLPPQLLVPFIMRDLLINLIQIHNPRPYTLDPLRLELESVWSQVRGEDLSVYVEQEGAMVEGLAA